MSKFTFVCQKEAIPFDDCISSKKTVEFSTYDLYDIISEFQNFLRGCGYCFEGQLEIVDDDEPIEYQKIKDELDNIQLPNFDFTNIPQNNWPFQNEQIKPLTVADLEKLNKSNFEMPGTLGGAKVTFASEN